MFQHTDKLMILAGAVGVTMLATENANAQCYQTTRVYREYYPSYAPVRVVHRPVYVERPYYYDSGRHYRNRRPYRSSGFSFGVSFSSAKHHRGQYFDGRHGRKHGRSFARGHSRHHSRHNGRYHRSRRRY